jgi:hypothetical protein
MKIIEQVMVEMVEIVARNLGNSETPTIPAPTLLASTTDTSASPSPTVTQQAQSNTTQSPLLFFVALGFGVVFTNLW